MMFIMFRFDFKCLEVTIDVLLIYTETLKYLMQEKASEVG